MEAESGWRGLQAKASKVARGSWKLLKGQWLPLCFVLAILVAMLAPAPGKAVVSVTAGPFKVFEMIPIICVFLISGLCLNTTDISKALKHWPGVLWGFITILGITPCLGFALRYLPLTPAEFAAGLAIFCCAPTTLGVGAALVRQAKGNDALATMLMTGTSVLSVLTIPLWLKALLGSSATASDGSTYSLSINIGKMLWQLLVTVLVPALVGKALRELVPLARAFAVRFKEALGMVSVACLAFIVWQTLSGAQELLVQQQFVDILYVIIAAAVQHLVYLACNTLIVAFIFRMPIEEGVAVIIMGSQKSAPVAVTAITFITPDVATQGLLSLPCIVGQLAQIFMGAGFAPFVAKKVKRVQAARKAAAAAIEVTAAASSASSAENGIAGSGVTAAGELEGSGGGDLSNAADRVASLPAGEDCLPAKKDASAGAAAPTELGHL